MRLKMTLAVAALLTIGSLSSAAYADTVTFTLTNPNGAIPITGGSETFDATVSAASTNAASVFLNGDSFNVTAPVTLDDSDFFSNFPLSLAPGASFTGDLFVLTVPAGSPFGDFPGTFTLLGGADGNASDTLGTVSFSLVTTPEPSSFILLGSGLTGVLATFKRKRSRA